MKIDNVFESRDVMKSFEFNQNVCSVFDNMVSRSVPGYECIQEIISLLYRAFSNNKIFIDVGCSTGTTIHKIISENQVEHCYGIDVSNHMLEKAHIKCEKYLDKITLSDHDFLHGKETPVKSDMKPDYLILNLILQFIRPPDRMDFISSIKANCAKNTTMVVFEKIIFPDAEINNQYIESYLTWKESQGYSKSEIENKRLALENRLVPYFDYENIDLFKRCGFHHVETCFSFLNFRGYLCR